MAEIKSIDLEGDKVEIKLSIDKGEYKLLKQHTSNLVVLPCGEESLTYRLTTGKLGNSNRIMIPKKLLKAFKIGLLEKKLPANIFSLDGDTYLLIKMKKSKLGIPRFEEETE